MDADQLTHLADRNRLLDALFQTATGGLGNYQSASEPRAKQIASANVRMVLAAMKAVAADPIELPPAFTEEEVNQVAEVLIAVRSQGAVMLEAIIKAQAPLLRDEDGNTVKDYTLTQKQEIDGEIVRLHQKVGLTLDAEIKASAIEEVIEEIK